MTDLPSPTIIGIVSSWSELILISDIIGGAKVVVFAKDFAGVIEQVADTLASGSGEQLVKISPPKAGSTLWASQSLNSATAEGNPATGPVVTHYPGGSAGAPQLISRLYEGSRGLWIEGVYPGATVKVQQNGVTLAVGNAAPLAGILQRPIGTRLILNQPIAANADVIITANDPAGAEIARAVIKPQAPRDDYPHTAQTRQLPPVVIDGSLAACSSGVLLSGVVDGAEVTLMVNGVDRTKAIFDRMSLTFLLSATDAVKEGDVVQAFQSMPFTSPSDPNHKQTVQPAPTPGLFSVFPGCAQSRGLVLAQIDPNAVIHIRMAIASGDIAEFEYPPAAPLDANNTRRFTLPSPLIGGSTLSVWQTRCENVGPTADVVIKEKPGELPAPTLAPPLRGCEEYIYVKTTSYPVRAYSALVADASGVGWEGGAISDWSISDTLRVYPPLLPGDKIRLMALACDEAPMWSPEDQPWIVENGLSADEAQLLATSLLFTQSYPPQVSELVENYPGPVIIQKGPKAHMVTLIGSASPQFLGRAIPDASGVADIKLTRRLQRDEMLMLEWKQCARAVITKGNATGSVHRVESPLAPLIEAPAAGQTGLKLGDYPVKVVDAGVYSRHRASWLSVVVRREGGPNSFQKTENSSIVQGIFTIDVKSATYVVDAFAGNEAGNSSVSTTKLTSEAVPPPPPPAANPTIVATTSVVNDGDYGRITISVTGKNFTGQSSGKLSAKYRTAYPSGANVGYENTDKLLKDFPIATDGSFTASGEATVQYYFRIADGSAIVVNQGVMVSVQIGSSIYELNLLPSDSQSL